MPAAPPQLTRRTILRTAIDLLDRDGYAAFSLPRLGDELGIRTPSLYHHFRDRAELLAEIARAVVRETPIPVRRPDAEWTEYFVELSVNFRRTILRHPNTAPVLLQFLPRDVLTSLYEESAVLLAETTDIPTSAHVLILDGLERFVLGNALIESTAPRAADGNPFPSVDPEQQPRLAAAIAANSLDAEERFVASVRAFLMGVAALP
ncbi:TetR/AcrR family transcriptional regulator [Cryptosporangium aurantiacum]|uniref:Transcriptional regulator, TetR family n=1 Tax=Cryptosporangium aurantiacum TaxID=134849 RepID=A0A1M7RK08_9ACTN|nr:TetR/AcrR family transcriptional regulator [Cryptosporangium aurantiacum]SHN46653.1 transcriptional regulator, TetR family [Cryptosporangium aurantiacum]